MPNINPGVNLRYDQLFSDDSVLRNSDTILNNGDVFKMGLRRGAPGAFPVAQSLFNPAASGVLGIVDDLIIFTDIVATVEVGLFNGELASDHVAWGNSKAGGAAGNLKMQSDVLNKAVSAGAIIFQTEAGVPFPLSPSVGWMVIEGWGLIVQAQENSVDLFTTYMGREFTI